MLKLYNIYKTLILESVDRNAIMDAIQNHKTVNITYPNSKGGGSSKRYCQVYNYGKTSSGQDAIRVYQMSGGGKNYVFKTFTVDLIENFDLTNWKYFRPISDENGYSGPEYKLNQDKTLGDAQYPDWTRAKGQSSQVAYSTFDDKYKK